MSAPVCGRCGVYKYLHPFPRCKGYRMSSPWDQHSLTHHVAAWLWIHVMRSSWRWGICEAMSTAGTGWRDWCCLVDCCIKADEWETWRSDYEGRWSCLCDFTMPWEVGAPRYGGCYCCVPPIPARERAS